MRRLTTKKFLNGHLMHYTVDGHGPWLVLIHSLATDMTVWTSHAKQLAKRFRVLRYDIRGHGKSGNYAPMNADSYTVDLLAGDLLAIMDALHIGSAHIVGISLGGMISQSFALKYPQRLNSLTLVSTTGSGQDLQQWDDRIAAAEAQDMEGLVDGFLATWFTPDFRKRHPEPMSRISRLIKSTDKLGFIRACRAIRSMDLAPRLGKVTVPALFIAGKDDPQRHVIEEHSVGLTGADKVEFISLPNAAQWAPLEQADAFQYCLNNFLQSALVRTAY